MFVVIEIPEHGLGVLATGGAQGTIRRHGHCVQVAAVSVVVSFELAVGQAPDLWEYIFIKYIMKHTKTMSVKMIILKYPRD